MKQEYYTTSQAVKIITESGRKKVGQRRLQLLFNKGILKGLHVGLRSILISHDSLHEFIKNRPVSK